MQQQHVRQDKLYRNLLIDAQQKCNFDERDKLLKKLLTPHNDPRASLYNLKSGFLQFRKYWYTEPRFEEKQYAFLAYDNVRLRKQKAIKVIIIRFDCNIINLISGEANNSLILRRNFSVNGEIQKTRFRLRIVPRDQAFLLLVVLTHYCLYIYSKIRGLMQL